ncbi:MAG: isoleucine--tRNA ligase [Candidatus Saccharimonadales bacterium]
MQFQSGSRRPAVEYERDLVAYWREANIFAKSVAQRPKEDAYVFYDGPPFITGVPHHGTLLSSIVKDAVPRYQTMKGRRVERKWGWDCHGLPAEVFTEQKLGIVDKRDIGTKISLEEYIVTCRDNMVATGDLWESTIERIGRWVDFRGAYKTMDRDYMESVWWAFKTLHDKGKIYEGERVLLYCTRDATPISKAEVAMDNSYQEVTDPSVYVKFKLTDREAYLLAWTTTPWTLPANTAVAVHRDVEYTEVEVDGQHLILASDLVDKVLTNEKHETLAYQKVATFKGSELVGSHYEPLFEDRGERAQQIWHADYVGTEDGTGIVHLAPAYGEEDFELAQTEGFPLVSNIDENGFYMNGEWEGQQVWEANKSIARELHERGIVWKIDYIRHSYPHCHRCGTKLMYRAHPSWFIDIDGQRQRMLEQNEDINWFPAHIKHGRFTKTVESAPDWNISRDRFWATAMPVWKGINADGQEQVKVVGSYAELKELSGVELEDYHRPWVDAVTFELDGVEYKRIDKVLDCWFESGSMPFAQFHYPFENKQKFEDSFPGDFIAEYVGQVRAWFYYLHAVSVGLFDEKAFSNVIVTGTLAGNDGRKMSKSFNNFTDPNDLMDQFSADALRLLLLSSPVLAGEDFALIEKDVGDVQRKLNMIWNMYDFFTMYAEVDGWEWDGSLDDPSAAVAHPLDGWILSRVHATIQTVDARMDEYDLPNAVKPLLELIEDMSNWYVRRSRKRFWKSEDDGDKAAAYRTLHYSLTQLSLIMAPFTPFLAEELYRKLTGGESVHLLDWPVVGKVDESTLERMNLLREVVKEGLAQRANAGLKVRQPLARVEISGAPVGLTQNEDVSDYLAILYDELNVKAHTLTTGGEQLVVRIDTKLTPELRREGMMREVVRHVQQLRKTSGFNVDDRIKLWLVSADTELARAIEEHTATIKAETLAEELVTADISGDITLVKVEDRELEVRLEQR